MIVGLGTDIIQVERMRAAIERRGERILNRLFTPTERAYCESRPRPVEHYAARFAAKEAAMKALGTGWRTGIGATAFSISLTPDEAYAMAVVVLEGGQGAPAG